MHFGTKVAFPPFYASIYLLSPGARFISCPSIEIVTGADQTFVWGGPLWQRDPSQAQSFPQLLIWEWDETLERFLPWRKSYYDLWFLSRNRLAITQMTFTFHSQVFKWGDCETVWVFLMCRDDDCYLFHTGLLDGRNTLCRKSFSCDSQLHEMNFMGDYSHPFIHERRARED